MKNKSLRYLPALCAITLSLAAAPRLSASPLGIANIVIGGGEQRCSSYTGAGRSTRCTADWDTILRSDPALAGLTTENILFEGDYPEPVWTYAVTATQLETLRRLPGRLIDPERKAALLARLEQGVAPAPLTGQPWAGLEASVLPVTLQKSLGLTTAEMSVVRNALVEPQALPPRKVQARSTRFTANAASVAIFSTFVEAARALNGGKAPLIGVVTASASPHPFVDRDLNVMALESAGANVVYLPLEGGFRKALNAGDCDHLRYDYDHYANTNPERSVFHGHLLFPDLARHQAALCAGDATALNATLRRLQGIYFSGGNQARHLESLVTQDRQGSYTRFSAQWQILQSRHAQGKLVVAGTSAGNHFQGGGIWRGKPVPMIGGGDSYDVLQSGYGLGQGPARETPTAAGADSTRYPAILYPGGGLAVFRFGVTDSHFSKRTREGRLIRAVADSGMDYGFGVDENTALVVSHTDAAGSTHFSVVGAAGVFIVDVRSAVREPTAGKTFALANVRAHYLRAGDTASIDALGQLAVVLATAAPILELRADSAPAHQNGIFDYGSSHFLQLATKVGLQGAPWGRGTTEGSRDTRTVQSAPYYAVRLDRTPDTVFRGHQPANGQAATLSYTGLAIAVEPCNGPCTAAP